MLVMRGRQPRWRPGMNAGFNGGGGGEQDALRTRKVLCTILLFMLLWESTGYRHMAMQARQQREMRRRGVAGGGAYPGESGLADALALGGSPSYADIHIDNHGGLPRDATGDARGAFCKRHGSQRRCLSFCCTAPPSRFSRRSNRDGEWGVSKSAVPGLGRHGLAARAWIDRRPVPVL